MTSVQTGEYIGFNCTQRMDNWFARILTDYRKIENKYIFKASGIRIDSTVQSIKHDFSVHSSSRTNFNANHHMKQNHVAFYINHTRNNKPSSFTEVVQ